jgi:hypothetical protein
LPAFSYTGFFVPAGAAALKKILLKRPARPNPQIVGEHSTKTAGRQLPRGLKIRVAATVDGLVKSRHSGGNRCPAFQQLSENTGFRLSPE